MITKEEVGHVAHLARLHFSEEEQEKFTSQLNDILTIKPEDEKALDVGKIKGVGGIAKVSVDFLISQLKKTNKHVSMQSRLLNGQSEDIEKVVGNWSRVSSKAKQKGSGWRDAIFDKDKD